MSLYEFTRLVVAIEIFAIVVILLGTYILKITSWVAEKQNKKYLAYLNDKLTEMMQEGKYKDVTSRAWSKFQLIVPLIQEYDKKYKENPTWQTIKDPLFKQKILPLAREKIRSRSMLNRLFAAQCFTMQFEPGDEQYLIVLLNDKVPLVSFYASVAAIRFGDQSIINLVITKMGGSRRHNHALYLPIFAGMDQTKYKYIVERLSEEKNLFLRTACYEILLEDTYPDQNINVEGDLSSDVTNKELKIMAMRYLAHLKNHRAALQILSLLDDPQWEVRAVATQLLGRLRLNEAIERISEGLRDPIWWVRVNSARALVQFGERGKRILSALDPLADRFAYETAQYVLRQSGAESGIISKKNF